MKVIIAQSFVDDDITSLARVTETNNGLQRRRGLESLKSWHVQRWRYALEEYELEQTFNLEQPERIVKRPYDKVIAAQSSSIFLFAY